MKRKLPLYVERSIQAVQADRLELTHEFESTVIGDLVLTCKPGCAACCYHPVLITVLEGIPLYRSLVAHGHWTPSFKQKLTKTSDMTSSITTAVWLLSRIACPLLDAKARCMAYAARPFACRVTVATGNAYFCEPQRLGDETSILPRQEVTTRFVKGVRETLQRHNLAHLTMPIGQALLLAERICSGQLTLENVDWTFVKEHLA
jgi:Fe-S-cluster containining protein